MSHSKVRPSLRLFQIFQAVVDEESFGRASHHISVSQPAISQGVKRLEALLRVNLFDRGGKSCGPSEFGSILRLRVDRLFNQIETALSEPLVGPPFVEGQRAQLLARRITEGQIRALAAIDETGSIDHAARQLGVSQPSVQRAARDLENLVRRPLYNRTARGLATTRSGAELARRLQLAVREIDYALDEIEAAKGSSAVRLAIGALPLSATSLLAATLNDLATEFPKARITVTDAAYDPLLQQLRSGRIDILFGVLRRPEWVEDVVEFSLFYDPYAIVVRPSHPLAGKKKVTIGDLARFDWLAPAEGAPRRRSIEALFAGSGAKPSISVETNSLLTQKALLAVSDRITLLTRHEAEFEARKGLLYIVEFDRLMPRRPDGLAIRKDWTPTPFQSRFMQLMEERARDLIPQGLRDDALRRSAPEVARAAI